MARRDAEARRARRAGAANGHDAARLVGGRGKRARHGERDSSSSLSAAQRAPRHASLYRRNGEAARFTGLGSHRYHPVSDRGRRCGGFVRYLASCIGYRPRCG